MAILVGAWTFFHTGTMLNLSNFLEIDHHKNVVSLCKVICYYSTP